MLPPATQVLPWQQPKGHVAGPHAPMPMHVCPLHVSPSCAQFWQRAPPVPHAVWLLPLTHVLPAQQPPGHVCGLHIDMLTQVWF